MPGVLTIAQVPAPSAAHNGSDLAAKAKACGWYPMLVIGGIIALAAVFVLLAKMRRDR